MWSRVRWCGRAIMRMSRRNLAWRRGQSSNHFNRGSAVSEKSKKKQIPRLLRLARSASRRLGMTKFVRIFKELGRGKSRALFLARGLELTARSVLPNPASILAHHRRIRCAVIGFAELRHIGDSSIHAILAWSMGIRLRRHPCRSVSPGLAPDIRPA